MFKLTTPDYDEFYSFESEQEAINFLWGATNALDSLPKSKSTKGLTLDYVLSLQDEYIKDDSAE
jgi:hypothetical protein